MKVVKSLFLFTVAAAVTSCFNAPEYSTTPRISFIGVCFKSGGTTDPDVLTLRISFRDGDGDLGLADQIEEPYNDIFYGIASSGEVVEAGKETVINGLQQFIKVPPGTTGKLVTTRTLLDPAYSDDLPPYVDAVTSCYDYKIQKVYIQEKDKAIIDASYPDIDTVTTGSLPSVYYIVQDQVYYKRNPNHRNIDVEFWENDGTGTFTLFDWEKEYCEASFNQRFPELSDKSGLLEGDLKYDMSSVGIRQTFGSKTLRLKVRIRDRALNVSNEVVSQDFTLDSISKNCE
ncbi:hypothetical protein WBG78_29400 [Chryseolinea sp. T2]|uniref:hypothetical protein n=1 Tax=Chryseolinea sp. T2 TaxID=3129255 RepID=UPI003076EAE6